MIWKLNVCLYLMVTMRETKSRRRRRRKTVSNVKSKIEWIYKLNLCFTCVSCSMNEKDVVTRSRKIATDKASPSNRNCYQNVIMLNEDKKKVNHTWNHDVYIGATKVHSHTIYQIEINIF